MSDSPETAFQPSLEESNAMVSRIGRLPLDSPVRRCALGLIPRQPLDTIQPLVEALRDRSPDRWREREVAAWALGRSELPSEETDVAVDVLLGVLENGRRPRLWPGFRNAFKQSSIATGIAMAALSLMFGPPPTPEDLCLAAFLLEVLSLALVPIVAQAYIVVTDPPIRAAAAVALGRLRVPKSMGALAGALFDRSAQVRAAAASALHELLPTLTTEHYGQFGAQTMINLGRALQYEDTDLVAKLLAALEKVGTRHAIDYVEAVAQRGRSVLLQDAARDVLEVLRERQQRESLRERLLRPAGAPDDPASILLRPAREAGAADERLLLRPARGDEETN